MAIICSSQSAKARGKRAATAPPPYTRVKVTKNITRKTVAIELRARRSPAPRSPAPRSPTPGPSGTTRQLATPKTPTRGSHSAMNTPYKARTPRPEKGLQRDKPYLSYLNSTLAGKSNRAYYDAAGRGSRIANTIRIAKLYAAVKVILKVAKENSEKGDLSALRAGQSASGSRGRGLSILYEGDKDLEAWRGRVKDILN